MVTCENKGKEMREIEFKVKFITPLLIGGANPREADPSGLTGKALRGCWRFWFRAIVGGMIKDIKAEKLRQLESLIFGSAGDTDINNNKVGAKFRIFIDTESELPDNSIKLGFNKPCRECKGKGCPTCKFTGKSKSPATNQGYLENSSYTIKVAPRNTMFDTELNVLLATIWVWGNLGTVGKRSRRGFGSPVIFPIKENNPFSFYLYEKQIELPIKQTFEYPWELEEHLQEGLNLAWKVFNLWIKENNFASNKKLVTDISGANTPKNSPFFLLRSCGQVFVGNVGFGNRNDAIAKFHGDSNCYGLGWAQWKKRMASPVFIRFHKVNNENTEELLPLVSWCQQKNVEQRDPKNCALSYIKNMQINGESIFVYNLNGGTL